MTTEAAYAATFNYSRLPPAVGDELRAIADAILGIEPVHAQQALLQKLAEVISACTSACIANPTTLPSSDPRATPSMSVPVDLIESSKRVGTALVKFADRSGIERAFNELAALMATLAKYLPGREVCLRVT